MRFTRLSCLLVVAASLGGWFCPGAFAGGGDAKAPLVERFLIAGKLADKGVRTWADLRDDDPDSSLPLVQRYKLVVVVSDVSRGKELRLPWDCEQELGLPADDQLVADAVRASASIPFFFRPFHMTADKSVTEGHGEILCTDGGMLSNFPIDIFDRTDGKLLWQQGVTTKEKEPTHQTNPYCPASPVTDGERVIASFASDGLYCYDFGGNLLWKRDDLGRQIHIWGNGASPVIHGDLCFLNFGPGENAQAHQKNESTDCTLVFDGYRILVGWLLGMTS